MLSIQKCHTWFSGEFVLKQSTQGWWAFKCPMCNELVNRQKMAVNFKYQSVKCWICPYRASIADFVMDYLNVEYVQAKAVINNCKDSNIDLAYVETVAVQREFSDVQLPHSYKTILEGTGTLARRAQSYLEGRGYDLTELDRMGIGYCDEPNDLEEDSNFFGYIIIPFKSRGKLVYYIGRDFLNRGEFGRYKNPAKTAFNIGKGDLIFNEDALNIYREIFCLEGWADACEMGKKGVSTQGWSLSNTQRRILMGGSYDTLVFIPDLGADNTGRTFFSKAVELAIDFIDIKKEVHVLDLREFEHFGKDVNEIGKAHVMELYKNSQPLTLSSAATLLMM